MQISKIMDLDIQETELVCGSTCDSVESCSKDAGRWFANSLEDFWDYISANPGILIA